ncbi:hypothetical protein B0T18DRAFT_429647 [Schizothecium vesticola]|uniref:Uncharacterized protein n=1 Tax=Schizothecium vesticola TaxID=314040 RepID=A0AA40EWB7_9PEZI|nr:hypothetical protein B0T18DRAFT_429647 [Schizothecium vesticola]
MQVCTNLKHLYSSLQEHITLRRKSSPKQSQRPLQISQPFNFKKEPCTLPGLTESEIFALREKAAASRIAILPDYCPPSPSSHSRCSSPGSARSLVINTSTDEDFFATAPPIPARSARRAASMMVFRGDGGVGAGWSTTSLPAAGTAAGSSGCSTPVDLDELFHVGPVAAVSEVMAPVARGRGRAGWRSASGSPTRG